MTKIKGLPQLAAGTNLVIDTLWGDNGKGKVIDLLAQYADVVVRFAGGDNAGHTIVNDHGKFALHVVPSGIFNPKALCIIAGGVVVNPTSLMKEISALQANGIEITSKNFLVSKTAHLIMPWHIKRDGLGEVARGGENIGTTGRGIGPTYSDRRGREGLRVGDLLHVGTKEFDKKLLRELVWQDRLSRVMNGETVEVLDRELLSNLTPSNMKKLRASCNKHGVYSFEDIRAELVKTGTFLKKFIGDALAAIWDAQEQGKNILGEGAQGALLDIDLGGYPFVTSSNTGAAGFTAATSIPDRDVTNIFGVIKAYATRVGSGPMPTELTDDVGMHLQTVGKEFGATTGRKRRCGWFDAVAAKYGGRDATSLAITKIDILDELPEVKICVAYEIQGKRYDRMTDPEMMLEAKPIYEVLPGWLTPTTKAKTYQELPANAQKFLKRLEFHTGKEISIVSVGPERESTILR